MSHVLELDKIVDLDKFKLFNAIETPSIIRINQFYIKIEKRNNGVGSIEMSKLTRYADLVSKDIILHATSSKNKRFYRRHGFINSPQDYTSNCNMRRRNL